MLTEETVYNLEIKESEMWVIEIALKEYSNNPVSVQHGEMAEQLYNRFKEMMLEKICYAVVEENGKKAAGVR